MHGGYPKSGTEIQPVDQQKARIIPEIAVRSDAQATLSSGSPAHSTSFETLLNSGSVRIN